MYIIFKSGGSIYQTKVKYLTLHRFIYFGLTLVITLLEGCKTDDKRYDNDIGYIDVAKALGDKSFQPCDSVLFQYYNFFPHAGYKYGKKALRDSVMKNFAKVSDDSGYLTIRFIINCKGVAGRYQIIENDLDLVSTKFNDDVKSQLIDIITKRLPSWTPLMLEGKPKDSYMYLMFKLDEGKIVEILP